VWWVVWLGVVGGELVFWGSSWGRSSVGGGGVLVFILCWEGAVWRVPPPLPFPAPHGHWKGQNSKPAETSGGTVEEATSFSKECASNRSPGDRKWWNAAFPQEEGCK